MKAPYQVVLETQGCKTCGHNAQWMIINEEGVGIMGQTFGDHEEACDIAEACNTAFELGCTVGGSERATRCKSCESSLYIELDEDYCSFCRATEIGVSTAIPTPIVHKLSDSLPPMRKVVEVMIAGTWIRVKRGNLGYYYADGDNKGFIFLHNDAAIAQAEFWRDADVSQ